jgi:transitional endoplasmic reticulum ATPase
VLLYGPPGTGKTLLAKAVANETNANFYSIGGPEIMSKFYGESEEKLRSMFKEAQENAPSIIFIDEIDSIAPKREEVSGELEKRIVSQLLSLMDGLESRGKIVVIGATNRPDALDPALRRPGRFDREIEIGIPDEKSRLEILQIHTRGMPLEPDVKLEEMARVTHGFVGADLQALGKEAAILAVRRVLPEIKMEETKIPTKILNKIKVKMQDFQDALRDVQPSAMREVLVQVPDVKWEDIGGLTDIKEELTEAVEWPLKYGKLFEKGDVKPPKGILLHGPPGTGKTMIAKAVANESEANFISIKGPELISKWVGESEKGVREVFRKARAAAPCVVFFDEMDAIAPRRTSGETDSQVTERVVSQILTEMDGLEELTGVVVLGATNRIDIIDEALLRPGRFDRILQVPPPDKDARVEILKIHTKKKPLAKDVDIAKLAERTEGSTGADLAAIANSASIGAIKRYLKVHGKEPEGGTGEFEVTMADFEEAIKDMKRKTAATSSPTRLGIG